MPQPQHARTVEQKVFDLVIQYRALQEEAQNIHDEGQSTGIAEEFNAIAYDMADLVQIMEGRVYRLRSRLKRYMADRQEARNGLNDLILELPEPHA